MRALAELRQTDRLVTHNYIVVETVALAQRRLGADGARALVEGLLPVIDLWWVDRPTNEAATSAFLAAVRRRTSLVDWVSFEIMRRAGIERALAFDRDFRTQGFDTVPR